MALDFAIGAVAGPLSAKLAPIQRQYLGPVFGPYSDEAALAIVGIAAHKFGSGMIRDAGRELFRVAVISAGNQIGASTVAGMLGTGAPSGATNDQIFASQV